MNDIINGTDVVLFKDAVAIAFVNSAKFSVGHSPRAASNKTDGPWEKYLEGKLNWSMSASGMAAFKDAAGQDVVGIDDLLADIIARTKLTVKFSTGDIGDVEYSGTIYLESVDLDLPDQESSTWSISGKGTGALTPAVIV